MFKLDPLKLSTSNFAKHKHLITYITSLAKIYTLATIN